MSESERPRTAIPHSAFHIPHSDRDAPTPCPGNRRPHRGRQDCRRGGVGRVRVHHRDFRRCPSGISGARHRHRKAVPSATGSRAAPRARCRRPGGALQRRPLRARRGAVARANPQRRPPAGGRGRNWLVRTCARGGPVPRAPTRPGAARAVAHLGREPNAGAACALGSATRPPVRRGRAATGRAGRRGRTAHGAGPQLVAAARA